MEAIILAGGLGTRLRSVILDIPKPMASINGRPFLTYLLDYLKEQGVTRVILAVGYKWQVIKDNYENSYEGIELVYSVEEEPLGTGGAIKNALEKANEENVFIINGDTYFEVDLKKMKSKFCEENDDLMIAIKPMKNFERYGKVLHHQERILGFEEKKFQEIGDINGGIYIVKKNFFNNFNLDKKFSFEVDILEKFVTRKKMGVFISEKYFIDIGIPEDYIKFCLKKKG